MLRAFGLLLTYLPIARTAPTHMPIPMGSGIDMISAHSFSIAVSLTEAGVGVNLIVNPREPLITNT